MFDEKINLIKSLQGTYKTSDKKMVVETIDQFKQQHQCSYKYAYDMCVEGNPSFSAYNSWRRQFNSDTQD
jgi:hypothetical protein